MQRMRIIYYSMFLLLLISCVKDPTTPSDEVIAPMGKGAFVLCEGLMGMNNSSLTRYDYDSKSIISDFYKTANLISLGDGANHIVRWGDTAFIAVSTNKKIIAINLQTGKIIRIISPEGKRAPRKIVILNDTIGYFTDLYDNSVTEFNPRTIVLTGRKAMTGPAPEGIGYYRDLLFVANSGLGDYLAKEPKAGTVSIIDRVTMQEVGLIDDLPDAVEIVVNQSTGKLYIAYYNLPSLEDSLGGIVEYDIVAKKEVRRWRCSPRSILLSTGGDSLFFIDKKGISLLELQKENVNPKQVIENAKANEFWYALSICPFDNTIWIGNAKNYSVNGEVLIYSLSTPSAAKDRFNVGVNPNTIIFYKK
jgi:hypothetical protein